MSSTRALFQRVSRVVKVLNILKMVIGIKVSMAKVSSMGKEDITGKMELTTKVSSKMVAEMEKGSGNPQEFLLTPTMENTSMT